MNLNVKETGKKDQETIIFLHEGGLAGWMWDKQLKAFNDYRCLVPDLPEHGRSMEFKPFTIKDTAEIIVNLIKNRVYNGKAHLVGLSLGAQIIIQILSTVPEVVDHALISGTLVHSIPHTETFLKHLNYLIKAYEPLKNTDFFIKANMRTYNIPKNFFNELKESTHAIKPESFNRILKENMLFQTPSGLEKANVPVLVIVGEKDHKILKNSARDLMHVLPNSKTYVVPKLGHVWNLESPELFNRVLRSWIANKTMFEI